MRGFKRDVDEPLPHNAIVVDEASMLDLFLANSLIDAHLLLVGNIDRLPSVGPGSVLGDLIKSERASAPPKGGRIPVRLTQVFRQAQSSGIIRAAHQIEVNIPVSNQFLIRRSRIVCGIVVDSSRNTECKRFAS